MKAQKIQNMQGVSSQAGDTADWLSSLMDGDLSGEERSEAVTDLCRDAVARERWETYHLIGDAMRDHAPLTAEFNLRMSERLAQEPTVLAPRTRRYAAPAAMALAATVVVVSVVSLMPGLTGKGNGLQMAEAKSRQANTVLAGNMDEQLVPYLVAHQELSPVAIASPYQRAMLTRASMTVEQQ